MTAQFAYRDGKYVTYADYESAMSRALAAEGALPRVWTAETIKDAPEGVYQMRLDTDFKGQPRWNHYLTDLDNVKRVLAEPDQYHFIEAFGPMPTPTNARKEP